jgi:hypothetical protein
LTRYSARSRTARRSRPRTGEAFDAHWTRILDDAAITAWAVLVGEALVGTISCFPTDGAGHVGYRIDRAYWGTGIASRALHLLLCEVTKRAGRHHRYQQQGVPPGTPEVRVRRRAGAPIAATNRYPECEEAVLVRMKGRWANLTEPAITPTGDRFVAMPEEDTP